MRVACCLLLALIIGAASASSSLQAIHIDVVREDDEGGWEDLSSSEELLTGTTVTGGYGEGRILLGAYDRARYRFLVDSMVYGDRQHKCVDFGSAERAAYKDSLKAIIQEIADEFGVKLSSWQTGVTCKGAAASTPPDYKFIRRIRTQVGSVMYEFEVAEFLAALQQRIGQNAFYAKVKVSLGESKWLPQKFTYNGGREAICVNFPMDWREQTNCKPDGRDWRPDQVTPY